MISFTNTFSFSSPEKPHLAVLTDGRVFTFYHCYKRQVWATKELPTVTDAEKAIVLKKLMLMLLILYVLMFLPPQEDSLFYLRVRDSKGL